MSDDTPTERFDPRRGRGDAEPGDRGTGDAASDTPADATSSDDAATEAFVVDSGDAPTRLLPQSSTPSAAPADQPPTAAPATERLGDDAPTEFIARTPPSAPRPESVRPSTKKTTTPPARSHGLRIALILLAALIVIGLAVLALVLATRDDDSAPVTEPSATAEPSAEPEPTEETSEPAPEPAPEPETTEPPAPDPAQSARFTSFTPADGSTIACPDETTRVPLVFEWSSEGAVRAFIAVGVDDAAAAPQAEVEPSGSYTDFEFDCSLESEIYTVTLDNDAGVLVNGTVTLVRELG
ncbi:hypothetical protein [Marisediminicola sp. LYQ134]|uniref:hypothetical protein n=1 Tax=unclassified Marisediminicola TaxID=2618316 RepID=UPI0039838142